MGFLSLVLLDQQSFVNVNPLPYIIIFSFKLDFQHQRDNVDFEVSWDWITVCSTLKDSVTMTLGESCELKSGEQLVPLLSVQFQSKCHAAPFSRSGTATCVSLTSL